ncbi:MAG: TSUP family transporter [Clostridia bacterium]|nr:TSUP family transporter [Clostridia bacterium]
MIYLLLSAVCAWLGLSSGIGATTLLRPLLDAVSPLEPTATAMLCTVATLSAALVSAFFALSKPLPLHRDELILLAVGAFIGGILGDLISGRFFGILKQQNAVLLQNALLFTLIALPALYFSMLSRTIRPLAVTRLTSLPAALIVGLLASFLAFGAVPLTLMLYYLLYDAEDDEAAAAALTISLCAMIGKLLVLFIRSRMNLPNAELLLWLLPGALLGALAPMLPGMHLTGRRTGDTLLRLSLFTSLINMAASFA